LRLARAYVSRSTEGAMTTASASNARARLQKLLTPPREKGEEIVERTPVEIAAAALCDPKMYNSGLSLAQAAGHAGSIIRERLSQDILRLLFDLEKFLQKAPPTTEADVYDRADDALRLMSAIAGLISENINRVAGWSFLDMGRRVERGISTALLARLFADKDATADTLEVLLDMIDSQITYRSRYIAGVALAPVRDMALLDPQNPRSVAFQAEKIVAHLGALPKLRQDGLMERPERIARALEAEIATCEAEKLDGLKIAAFENNLSALAIAIEERYFLQGKNAVRAETNKGLG
jgi:uncharacterized alpha-E superfamily protein